MNRRLSSADIVVIFSGVALLVLITLVSLLAFNTISSTVSVQFRSQERQLVGTFARQFNFFLQVVSADLVNLAARPEVQSITFVQREPALLLLDEAGQQSENHVRKMVRLTDSGLPRYAWPPELNVAIRETSGTALDWSLSLPTIQGFLARDEPAFRAISTRDSQRVFLLAAPVQATSARTELLVFELDLEAWFAQNFSAVELGQTGQLWVIDERGSLLYEASSAVPTWAETEGILSVPQLTAAFDDDEPRVVEYDASDARRQAAFAQAQAGGTLFVVILSRPVAESQVGVQQQLALMFALTAAAVVLVAGISWLGVQRLQRVERQRLEAEQRRASARALLEVSRALNSSLDLDTVLQRILAGLGDLLAHDSASIMLYSEDGLVVKAFRGDTDVHSDQIIPLDKARAAGIVFETGQPILVNNVLADHRWGLRPESLIRSWLGVPLRVQDETVGVLNINSHHFNGFRQDDVDFAQAFADQSGVAINNARLHEAQVQQYEQELANAQDIQRSLLPEEPFYLPQFEVIGQSLPARVVSGDFYQFLPRLDGRLGVAVGDVTGKGMPAALLMAVVTTALRREIEAWPSLAPLYEHLNRTLIERLRSRHMTGSLIMALCDPATRDVEIANAGMVQPYLRLPGGHWTPVPVSGYPIGASMMARYTSRQVRLEPGTVLVFVSDGVLEAQNSLGEFFGFDRLEALLATFPPDIESQDIIIYILEAVYAHLDTEEIQDDITVVVLRSLEVQDKDDPAASQDVAIVAALTAQEAAGEGDDAL